MSAYDKDLEEARLKVLLHEKNMQQFRTTLDGVQSLSASFFKHFAVWIRHNTESVAQEDIDTILAAMFAKKTSSSAWRMFLLMQIVARASDDAIVAMGATKYHFLRQCVFVHNSFDLPVIERVLERFRRVKQQQQCATKLPFCITRLLMGHNGHNTSVNQLLVREAMRDGVMLYCKAPRCRCVTPDNSVWKRQQEVYLNAREMPDAIMKSIVANWMKPTQAYTMRMKPTPHRHYFHQGHFVARFLRAGWAASRLVDQAYIHYIQRMALPLLQAGLPPYVIANIVRFVNQEYVEFAKKDTLVDRVTPCVRLQQSINKVHNERALTPKRREIDTDVSDFREKSPALEEEEEEDVNLDAWFA